MTQMYIIPVLRNNEKSDQSHVRAIKARVVNNQHYFVVRSTKRKNGNDDEF